MKYKKPAIIVGLSLFALLAIGWFSGFFIWLALESTRKHEDIGEIERITPDGTSLPFDFPEDRRGWPFYVEESAIGEFEDSTVEVWIENSGPEAFTVTVREIDSESTGEFSLAPGEEAFVLAAGLSKFVGESKKRGRLKTINEDYFTQWPPLFYIRSSSGKRVRGVLRFTSEREISLHPPIRFYSDQPRDTI